MTSNKDQYGVRYPDLNNHVDIARYLHETEKAENATLTKEQLAAKMLEREELRKSAATTNLTKNALEILTS
jgi:hypothetical protein